MYNISSNYPLNTLRNNPSFRMSVHISESSIIEKAAEYTADPISKIQPELQKILGKTVDLFVYDMPGNKNNHKLTLLLQEAIPIPKEAKSFFGKLLIQPFRELIYSCKKDCSPRIQETICTTNENLEKDLVSIVKELKKLFLQAKSR